MTFDLMSQIISYLKAISDYVSFLEVYVDRSVYDDFDKAYASFYEAFTQFIWDCYRNPDGALRKLVEEFGEIKVPLEESMIAFCLEGLKHHNDALFCCLDERKRIYGKFLEEHLGITDVSFLAKLNKKQWEVFEACIFQAENAQDLQAILKENQV